MVLTCSFIKSLLSATQVVFTVSGLLLAPKLTVTGLCFH